MYVTDIRKPVHCHGFHKQGHHTTLTVEKLVKFVLSCVNKILIHIVLFIIYGGKCDSMPLNNHCTDVQLSMIAIMVSSLLILLLYYK